MLRRSFLAAAAALATSAAALAGSHEIPPEFADASAVVLEDYTSWVVGPGKKERRHVRKRILIRDRGGFDHADQFIVYWVPDAEIVSFEAYTALPDGTVIPVSEELRHDSVLERSGAEGLHQLSFTFPAVRVGAELRWEYEIVERPRRDRIWWSVQDDIPVLLGHFEGRVQRSRLPLHAYSRAEYRPWCDVSAGEQRGGAPLEIVCRDLPGLRDEHHAPPWDDLAIAFLILTGAAGSRSPEWVHWDIEAAFWEQQIAQFTARRENLRARLRQLDLAGLEAEEKIERIYLDVVRPLHIREAAYVGEFEGRIGEARSVDDVLTRGGGQPLEVTLLTLALLQEAGLPAYAALVNDRTHQRFDPKMPDDLQAQHLMVLIRFDGPDLVLDPACRYCPPGVPDWRYSGEEISGLLLGADEREFVKINMLPASSNLESRSERVELASDGTARVSGNVSWDGQVEVYVRQYLSAVSEQGRHRLVLSTLPDDRTSTTVRLPDPDLLDVVLEAEYDYRRGAFPRTEDGRILIGPDDSLSGHLPGFDTERRQHPMATALRRTVRQEVTFVLPVGFDATLPAGPVSFKGPGMRFDSEWRRDEGDSELHWQGVLTIERWLIDAADYPAARAFASRMRRTLRDGVTIQAD